MGKHQIKVAILDLYNGTANLGISAFEKLLANYKAKHQLNLSWQVFDVRKNLELPDTSFDIYLSSGGPGNPFTAAEEWDKQYFNLIEALAAYNTSVQQPKKHALFVCHSFQLMCRHYGLGRVCLRDKPSYGIVPIKLIDAGYTDAVLQKLPGRFYALDSRSWQVIEPEHAVFTKMGAKLLAIEQDIVSPGAAPALMAIRFNDYFIGTQFHPESEPVVLRESLLTDDRRQQVIAEQGEAGYYELLNRLQNPDMMQHTYAHIIPAFLREAITALG